MAGENGKIKQTCSAMWARGVFFPLTSQWDRGPIVISITQKTTGSLTVLLGLHRLCPYAIAAPRATCPRHIGHAALFQCGAAWQAAVALVEGESQDRTNLLGDGAALFLAFSGKGIEGPASSQLQKNYRLPRGASWFVQALPLRHCRTAGNLPAPHWSCRAFLRWDAEGAENSEANCLGDGVWPCFYGF